MANPQIIDCPADEWTEIATGVTTGLVHVKQGTDAVWLQTYRLTGEAAPTDKIDAIALEKPTDEIGANAPIDVYVYPEGKAGKVRVDL